MLSCDEDHPSVRNSLILSPDPDCVEVGLGRACTVPGLPAGRVCSTRLLQNYFNCELEHLSSRYLFPTVERSRFNVASCVIRGSLAVATIYIEVLAYWGEERREVQVHVCGYNAKNYDTAAVRAKYEVVWRLLLLLLLLEWSCHTTRRYSYVPAI